MKLVSSIILSLLILAACGEKPKSNAHWGTPEHVATEFFHAIYNENNLEKAKSLSTKKYAALMQAYVTPRQVARTLFNMSYDEVTIEVNRSGQNLRQQYDDSATITLVFRGLFADKKVDNMRTVSMIKKGGKWLVEAVDTDPFSNTPTY